MKMRSMCCLYIINDNKMLMLYRIGSRALEKPKWVGIGGHMEQNELNNPKATILREIYEESKIKEDDISNLKLRYVTLRNKNNEIRQNFYFFARLKDKTNTHINSNEGKLEWVDIKDILTKDMPDSARCLLNHYSAEGKNTDLIYGIMGVNYNNTTKYIVGELK